MENETKGPITMGAKDGKSLSVVGDTYRILIAGRNTGGAFSTIDMLIPPGGGPGPHAHTQIEESFYIIEGEVEFVSESGLYTAMKGDFVCIPKGGLIHSFKNKTSQVAHMLCTVVPSGLDAFFEEVGLPVENGEFLPHPVMDPAYAKKIKDVAEKYGQHVYPPDQLQ
jgi:quercetin dioxygenase-like cupin family protein